MKILWLRVSKGDNISVRRERIAAHLEAEGYDITIRDSSWFDAFGAAWEALTGDYDLIVGGVRMGLFIGYPIARLRGLPILSDVSDPQSDIDYFPWPLYQFFCWYEWQLLKRVDHAVFVYESMYEEALERGISTASRLPNAVDLDVFMNPDAEVVEEAKDILEGIGVDLTKPVAIYIGGFSPSYHIKDIIESAKESPSWEFVFVGEGKLQSSVIDAASTIENVSYPGAFRHDLIPGFLSFADAGFCFKDAEQPLKLKEYAAAGVPVIAQPGELSKWYSDEDLVFVEPTATEISDALERLSAEEHRRTFVEAGLTIASEYSWEEIADGYDDLFQSVGH